MYIISHQLPHRQSEDEIYLRKYRITHWNINLSKNEDVSIKKNIIEIRKIVWVDIWIIDIWGRVIDTRITDSRRVNTNRVKVENFNWDKI